MKKAFNLTIIAFTALILFAGCASKPKVLSSKSSKHLTVQQTNMGVYIVAHKEKSEDINTIQIIDSVNGNGAIINLENETSVEFLWPFADSGKTYTINANLSGKHAKSQETVTFTTDSVSSCMTSYNQDYLDSKLVLIATGNKRIVKLNTKKEALTSVINPTSVSNPNLTIDIFTGKHFNATEDDYELIGTINKKMTNILDIQKLIDGYDIISTASAFGITSAALNSRLSKNPTYFARACITFNISDGDASVTYTTKYIYTNDTIYTPITSSELPDEILDQK